MGAGDVRGPGEPREPPRCRLCACGMRSCRDRHGVEQIAAHLFPQPVKVSHVMIGDIPSQFDLHGEDATIRPLDDEVDLMTAPLGPEVFDFRLRRLCVDPDTLRDERFE